MYWADQGEMERLEQLSARDRTGFKLTPRELTVAVSPMPTSKYASTQTMITRRAL